MKFSATAIPILCCLLNLAASPASQPPIPSALAAINQKSAHPPLTREAFLKWAEEYCRVSIDKQDRAPALAALHRGLMPPGWEFELADNSVSIQPPNLPLQDAQRTFTYSDYLRNLLSPKDLELTTEPYIKPFPALNEKPLSPTVGVRITTIQVQGTPLATPAERDSLKIEIQLQADTLDEIVRYFGLGFDRAVLRANLLAKLKLQQPLWLDLKQIIPNWVGQAVSTFPNEKQNEVCHGPAREFYYPTQDPRLNKGTETSELLLLNFYHRLETPFDPVFGDYVYKPGRHSARYILKDPRSKRHIIFSIHSGGNIPYRFWWLDEDFSTQPYGHKPEPRHVDATTDFWRRCM